MSEQWGAGGSWVDMGGGFQEYRPPSSGPNLHTQQQIAAGLTYNYGTGTWEQPGAAPAPAPQGFSMVGGHGGAGQKPSTSPLTSPAPSLSQTTYDPQVSQNIKSYWSQNQNNPKAVSDAMRQYGISNDHFMNATGMNQSSFDNYFSPVFGNQSQPQKTSLPGQAGYNAPTGADRMGGNAAPLAASVMSAEQNQGISSFYQQNQNNPFAVSQAMDQYGVSAAHLAAATGMGLEQATKIYQDGKSGVIPVGGKITPTKASAVQRALAAANPETGQPPIDPQTGLAIIDMGASGWEAPGTEGRYRTYDFSVVGDSGDKSKLNGTKWEEFDKDGNKISEGIFQGLKKSSHFGDLIKAMVVMGAIALTAGAAAGAMGGAGAGLGATTAGAEAAIIGTGGIPAVGTGAGSLAGTVGAAGAGSTAASSGTSYGLGSGSSGLGLSSGGSGLGLQATPGLGTQLAAPAAGSLGGGLGLQAATGSGLALVAPAAGSLGGGLGLQAPGSALGTVGSTVTGGTALTPGVANGTPGGIPTPSTGVPGGKLPLGGLPGGSGSGAGLMDILNGLYSAHAQQNTSREMLDWMNKQMKSIDDLYAPGSPEHTQMKEEMERKDAAAGRNSQYGVRAVDLAGRITTEKARQKAVMANAMQNNFQQAFQTGNNRWAGLSAALGKGGVTFESILGMFQEGGTVDSILDLFN